MATVDPQAPVENCFRLHGVSWEMYESLRAAPENDHVRMTFDGGDLEMMSPSRLHERWARLIGRLIDVWTEEREVAIDGCGSMTFSRADLEQGLEPDNCYYIQHEPLMRAKREVDWLVDPPPDLAIEIEVSRSSLKKLRLYEAFKVPEIWRYDGTAIRVYTLGRDGRYSPVEASLALPGFPLARAAEILGQLGHVHATQLVRTFRSEVRIDR